MARPPSPEAENDGSGYWATGLYPKVNVWQIEYTEIATARGFARARIIGGTRREQPAFRRRSTKVTCALCSSRNPRMRRRLGGPPPSRGEVGQIRASWGAWGRAVGLRTLRQLPSVVVPTGQTKGLAAPASNNPSSFMVAGAGFEPATL